MSKTPTMGSAGRKRQRSVRVILLSAFCLALYLVCINSAATQYTAAYYSYHPALGRPVFGLIYTPWSWWVWLQLYFNTARELYIEVLVALILAFGAGLLAHVLFIGFRTRSSQIHEGIHGTAHFASEAEIRATGLLPQPGQLGAGAYVGGWTDQEGNLHYLRHNGPEHIGVIGPTRSAKGVSLISNTLLSWPESVLALDQKEELANLTSGWRATVAGNDVYKFDPVAPHGGVSINPLAEIRLGTEHEVGDAQDTVTMIVDPDGRGLVDHWSKTAHALLTGVVLHVLYKAQAEGREGCLPDLAFAFSDPEHPIEHLWEEMLTNQYAPPGLYGDTRIHPVIASSARDMVNRPDEERGSVLSTALSYLTIYRDPLVRKNTSHSGLRISALQDSARPVTLYLIARPENKDRLRPLIRLIINQVMRVLLRPPIRFVDGLPQMPHKHRLLLMLDEFPSYGRLDVFVEGLAHCAAYGIKAYLVMQDIAQLLSAYSNNGKDEPITGNLHIRIVFAPNRLETAQWISRMTGVMTIVKEHISTSGNRFGAFLQQVSRDYREESRPLMTEDEVMRLKAAVKDGSELIIEPGEVLVFVAGHAPIRGTQTLYFRDPTFLARSRIPPQANGHLTGTAERGNPAELEPFAL
jgi:type IV secretion system protein VirD4